MIVSSELKSEKKKSLQPVLAELGHVLTHRKVPHHSVGNVRQDLSVVSGVVQARRLIVLRKRVGEIGELVTTTIARIGMPGSGVRKRA